MTHVPLMVVLAPYGINGVATSHVVIGITFVTAGLYYLGHVIEIGVSGIWALVRPHALAGLPAVALLAAIMFTRSGTAAMAGIVGSPVLLALVAGLYVVLLSRIEPSLVVPLRELVARLPLMRRRVRPGPSPASL